MKSGREYVASKEIASIKSSSYAKASKDEVTEKLGMKGAFLIGSINLKFCYFSLIHFILPHSSREMIIYRQSYTPYTPITFFVLGVKESKC